MKRLLSIALFFLFFLQFSNADDLISKEDWKEQTTKHNYTESYKEFKTKEREKSTHSFDTAYKPGNGRLFKNLTLIFIGLILAALIVLLILNLIKIKSTSKVKTNLNIEEDDDPDKHQLDELELYLKQALDQQNYKLAVRINFLILIKNLKENNRIIWKKDKTNRDYYFELVNEPYSDTFREVARFFERVWYADYPIEESMYSGTVQKFNHINSMVSGR